MDINSIFPLFLIGFSAALWGVCIPLLKRAIDDTVVDRTFSFATIRRLATRFHFIIAAILMIVGFALYMTAISMTLITIVGAVSTVMFPAQIISASFILKEKVKKNQLIGIVLIMLGIMLFGIGYTV
ncbi:MAG: EamA family transporter [Thermoplasmata archaeon]